ncbi:MAG: V-type ATP synthase subunit D [Gemmatimonadetes bacterium]|nr:V-type ATP synthase subunit D [Gemmatimonadota bacterium]
MSDRPPATRQVLLRTRRQLDRMQKGTTMLRRKREALVAELFQLARPAASARQAIASEATQAYGALLEAYAREGHAGLRAWAWPSRELTVEIRPLSVWGVPASAITDAPTVARTAASRGTPPGPARAALLETAEHFERLVDRLVTSAPRELLLQRLGQALSSTTRQVNVLEQRLAPGLARQLTDVRRRLEEREREEHVRLERLKARTTSPA